MHIKQSTRKSLIENLSKRLFELEFKSKPFNKKCLKWIVKDDNNIGRKLFTNSFFFLN